MIEIPYISAIKSLMHVMLYTQPYITYVVSMTSMFQSNLGMQHQDAIKTIFKYLKRSKYLVLTHVGGDLQIDGFIDDDLQSNVNDRSPSLVMCSHVMRGYQLEEFKANNDNILHYKIE